MTIDEFFTAITAATELPVFYEIIDVEQEEEMPPVYIYFTTGESEILEADNITYWSSTPVSLVIVHGSEGIKSENKTDVEYLLNSERLPFTVIDSYDSDLTSWLSTYSFNI